MPTPQRLDAVFFRSESGCEPVREWLKIFRRMSDCAHLCIYRIVIYEWDGQRIVAILQNTELISPTLSQCLRTRLR